MENEPAASTRTEPVRSSTPDTPPTAPTGRKSSPVERLCHATGAALVVSGLLHLIVFAVDGGPWDGPVSWRKPVTFGLSFGLTLIAICWVASYVRLRARTRTVLLAVFAADCVLEVVGITLQAWRGVPSHFNMETPFDTAVSMSLAVGGAVLVVILTVLAVASFVRRPEGPTGMALALRAGFAILVVGLLAGAAMIARGVYLTRTGHQLVATPPRHHSNRCTESACTRSLCCPCWPGCWPATPWSESTRRTLVRAAVGCYAVAVVGALTWAVVAY